MFDTQKKYFAERRITDRMARLGCATFREYFATIRFEASGEEMQRLVNQMTVNETYFFREDYQLKALVAGILPDLAARRRKGQAHPHLVGAVLVRRGALFPRHLHPGKLGRRRSPRHRDPGFRYRLRDPGRRRRRRLCRALPATAVAGPDQAVFHQTEGQQYRISDDIRGSIDFSQGNVVDPPVHAYVPRRRRDLLPEHADLFRRQSRRETVEAMYDCLSPGGYICLGHSESMSRISSLFRPRKYADSIIYQKPFE
jgi:chemotaxis protein methyltransferase CheR